MTNTNTLVKMEGEKENKNFEAGLNYVVPCGAEYPLLQTEVKEGTDININ